MDVKDTTRQPIDANLADSLSGSTNEQRSGSLATADKTSQPKNQASKHPSAKKWPKVEASVETTVDLESAKKKFAPAKKWPTVEVPLVAPGAASNSTAVRRTMHLARTQWVADAQALIQFKPATRSQSFGPLQNVGMLPKMPTELHKALDHLKPGWQHSSVGDLLTFLDGEDGKKAVDWATQGRPNPADLLAQHPVTEEQRAIAARWVDALECYLESNPSKRDEEIPFFGLQVGREANRWNVPQELEARLSLVTNNLSKRPLGSRLAIIKETFLETPAA